MKPTIFWRRDNVNGGSRLVLWPHRAGLNHPLTFIPYLFLFVIVGPIFYSSFLELLDVKNFPLRNHPVEVVHVLFSSYFLVRGVSFIVFSFRREEIEVLENLAIHRRITVAEEVYHEQKLDRKKIERVSIVCRRSGKGRTYAVEIEMKDQIYPLRLCSGLWEVNAYEAQSLLNEILDLA